MSSVLSLTANGDACEDPATMWERCCLASASAPAPSPSQGVCRWLHYQLTKVYQLIQFHNKIQDNEEYGIKTTNAVHIVIKAIKDQCWTRLQSFRRGRPSSTECIALYGRFLIAIETKCSVNWRAIADRGNGCAGWQQEEAEIHFYRPLKRRPVYISLLVHAVCFIRDAL